MLTDPLLTPAQFTTLHALMDRLIPPDQDCGASDAGVGDYLARQLTGDLRDYLETYRAGLDTLDAEARHTLGQPFAALTEAGQDALLHRVEAGAVSLTWPTDPAAFFQAVVQHVAEGYYSDPGNGGNRDAAAWQMIGFVPGLPGSSLP